MNSKMKKILVTTLVVVMVLSTVAMAANQIVTKKISATYGRVKFNYNGVDVTNQVENKYGTPGFLSGGRSYVPVRALADVLGVGVDWNEATSTVIITGGGNTALLQQQLDYARAENQLLKDRIKELEDGTSSSSSGKSIRDIESKLIKDYDSFEKIRWSITLSGDTRDVDLRAELDLSNSKDKDYWDGLSERSIERFIEDMVSDIQREYRDINVKGEIRDKDARENLYTFEKRGDRSIDISRKSASSANARDMESKLKRRYDTLKDVKDITFDVKETSSDRYEIKARVDYKKYEREWDSLDKKDMKSYSSDAIDYVESEFRSANVRSFKIVKDSNDDTLYTY